MWLNRTTTFSCKSPTFNLNITLSNAGAFLFSETETDSIHYNGYLNVTADRVGYGEGCTSLSGIDASRTDVTLMLPMYRDLQGTSVNAACKNQNIN